jgi:hypothetical protein
MTPQRILVQFLEENPWCKTHTDPINEYGLPLTPSATYHFFKWLAGREPMAAQILGIEHPAAECERLLARFGEPIKDGHVGSWHQELVG